MPLTSELVRIQYNGDGATVAFAVPYVFWDADDLRVIHTDSSGVETVWVRGTQYDVSGGSGLTGTVTVETSPTDYTPAVGETLTIISNIDDIQETSLPNGGPFPSPVIEQQLNKIVRMIQQKDESIGRALSLAESAVETGLTLPELSGNAGKTLIVNEDEDGFDLADTTEGGSLTVPVPVVDGGTGSATAAAARTALGVEAAQTAASQAEAEAGTEAAIRSFSPLRIAQAIAALESAGSGIPSGSVMLFYQSAAPTGWTKDTTAGLDDHALRVVTSTGWTSGTQGTNAFSSAMGASGLASQSTSPNAPTHNHQQTMTDGTNASRVAAVTRSGLDTATNIMVNMYTLGNAIAETAVNTQNNSGGGSAHTHDMDIDIKFLDLIIASKD